MNKEMFGVFLLLGVLFATTAWNTVLPDLENTNPIICEIGERPLSGKTVSLPKIKNRDNAIHDEGGPDVGNSVNYILVRTNVPIINSTLQSPVKTFSVFDDPERMVKYPDASNVSFDVYYPNKTGGLTLSRTFQSKYEGATTEFRFAQEGFIFFVHKNSDGTSKTIKATARDGSTKDFLVVDIYQDNDRRSDATRGYSLDEIFKCQNKGGEALVFSRQNKQGGKQLQLQTFSLQQGGGFDAH